MVRLEHIRRRSPERWTLTFAADQVRHDIHVVYHEPPKLPPLIWRICLEELSLACLADLSTATMARKAVLPDPGAVGRDYFLSACHALRLESLHDTGGPLTDLPLLLSTTEGLPRGIGIPPGRPDRLLLLMGGGKDSLYCYRLLSQARYDLHCFYLTEPRRTWQQLRRVRDHLAPETTQHRVFLDVSRRGPLERRFGRRYFSQFQIGQVVAAALPYALSSGCRYMVLGLERSSDQSMTTYGGMQVNHQHQKTTALISAYNCHIQRRLDTHLALTSPLKGLYDMGIYARFLKEAPSLVPFQSSCGGSCSHRAHCGRCPKCAFLAALLAGLSGDRALYRRLFPRDPLQVPELYTDWLSTGSDRPLTCAGLKDEVQLGLRLAISRGWQIPWLDDYPGVGPDVERLRHLLAAHVNPLAPPELLQRIGRFLEFDDAELVALLSAT